MNYLEKRLKEIEEISAYNVNGRKEKFTKQLLEQGFHDGDIFDLWTHLIDIILPRLKRFQELKFGYPGNLSSFEQWTEIIDKMIIAFKLLEENKFIYEKEEEDKIDESLKLFVEWFRNLWW